MGFKFRTREEYKRVKKMDRQDLESYIDEQKKLSIQANGVVNNLLAQQLQEARKEGSCRPHSPSCWCPARALPSDYRPQRESSPHPQTADIASNICLYCLPYQALSPANHRLLEQQ